MPDPEKLIPLHDGYWKSKGFQVAPVCVQRTGRRLAYDATVLFCERIKKRSRTLAALRDALLPKFVLSELLRMNRNEKAMPFAAISCAHENEAR